MAKMIQFASVHHHQRSIYFSNGHNIHIPGYTLLDVCFCFYSCVSPCVCVTEPSNQRGSGSQTTSQQPHSQNRDGNEDSWISLSLSLPHLSSELTFASRLNLYWNPEQPPPSTVTLSSVSVSPSVISRSCYERRDGPPRLTEHGELDWKRVPAYS